MPACAPHQLVSTGSSRHCLPDPNISPWSWGDLFHARNRQFLLRPFLSPFLTFYESEPRCPQSKLLYHAVHRASSLDITKKQEVHLLACYLRGTQTTAAAPQCRVNGWWNLLSRLPAPGNKKRGKAENYKLGRKIKLKVNNSHMRSSTYIHMRGFELRYQVGQKGRICPSYPEA